MRSKGARAYFFETRELLRLVRDTYNRSVEETEMEVLKPLLEADLLVLDDLGAERTSEWVQETLGLVVNTRYNAKRPTIFTSNLIDVPDDTDPRSFIFQLGARTPFAADRDVRLGRDSRCGHPRGRRRCVIRSHRAVESRPRPHRPTTSERSTKLPPRARTQARAHLRALARRRRAEVDGREGGVLKRQLPVTSDQFKGQSRS